MFCNFKKQTLTQVFSYEFCEIFKTTFFTEHLWTSASENGCIPKPFNSLIPGVHKKAIDT